MSNTTFTYLISVLNSPHVYGVFYNISIRCQWWLPRHQDAIKWTRHGFDSRRCNGNYENTTKNKTFVRTFVSLRMKIKSKGHFKNLQDNDLQLAYSIWEQYRTKHNTIHKNKKNMKIIIISNLDHNYSNFKITTPFNKNTLILI